MLSCRKCAFATLVAFLLSSSALPAIAQSISNDNNSQIETVVVTAEKRQEVAQNVPASITAITGSQATALGIKSSNDLTQLTPALSWNQSNAAGSPYIRGVGSLISTAGNLSDVPVYMDGVLLISPVQYNFNFNNVERIEVLEGPQGTLFGRNAAGGVINIVTRDPSRVRSADLSLGYGNYNTLDVQADGNTPITETLAANVAIDYHNQFDGWGHNILTGKQVYRDRSFNALGKLDWQPDASTDLILTASYGHSYSNLDNVRIIQGTVGQLGGVGPAGFYDANNSYPSFIRTDVTSVSLRASHEFGIATFRSITSYTDMNAMWSYDSDGGPLVLIEGPIPETASGFTQEFQLVSPTDQKLTWIAGLFYIQSDYAFVPIVLNGINVGGSYPGGMVDVWGHTGGTSYAAYAQSTWAFLPHTNLTLGGRYTIDNRTVDGHVDVAGTPGTKNYQTANFQQPTYRVALDHHFSADVMAYASMSDGFNSGQFNTGNAFAPAVQPEEITAYEVGFKSQYFDHRLQVNAAAYLYNFRGLQVNVIQNAVTLQTNAAAAHIRGVELSIQAVPIPDLHLGAALSYNDAYFSDYNNAQIYGPLPTGGYTTVSGDVTGNRLTNAPMWSYTLSASYDLRTEVGDLLPAVNYSYKARSYQDYQNSLWIPPQNELNASLTFDPAGSSQWEFQVWGKNLLDEKTYASMDIRNEAAQYTPAAPLTYGVDVTLHL